MTTTRIFALGALAAAILFSGLACGSDPGGTGVVDPPPGPLTVSLATPSRDDGALLVVVTGPFTDATATSAAYTLYWRRVSDTETRVAVVGNIVNGPLFTVEAPEGTAASAFTATLSEVADRADAVRTSTTGYSLSVSR